MADKNPVMRTAKAAVIAISKPVRKGCEGGGDRSGNGHTSNRAASHKPTSISNYQNSATLPKTDAQKSRNSS